MAATTTSTLYDGIFKVTDSGREGKRPFERVARVHAESLNDDMTLILDTNSEIYPLEVGQEVTLALASSLSKGGEQETEEWRLDKQTLADEYEYVCYGQVYKFDESSEDRVSVYISFGGLLMCLTGSYRYMSSLTVGNYVYLLLRK